jgi:hypothetical protein
MLVYELQIPGGVQDANHHEWQVIMMDLFLSDVLFHLCPTN